MKDGLLAQLNSAYEFFKRSTGNLTEEDSAYAPAEGVFTAAGQVAHAAQTIDWFMDGAFNPKGFDMNFPAHAEQARAVTSLTEAQAWLTRSVENARSLIASKSEDDWTAPIAAGPVMGGQPRTTVFGGIADHTAHHRGALTVYARLRGKTPPNPYMEAPAE